jgi:FlaA1/EpsC-like NDP-sugar epimerase
MTEPTPESSSPSTDTSPLDKDFATRPAVTVSIYAGMFFLSLLGAFALAYNFHRIGEWFYDLFLPMAALAIPIKTVVFWRLRLYRGTWRYVGLQDMLSVVRASHISSFLFISAYFVIEYVADRFWGTRAIDKDLTLRQATFLLDWAGTIGLVCFCRIVVRLYHEEIHAERFESQSRVLIVGAGDTGEAVLREIHRMSRHRYEVVGLLDDRPTQHHRTIHGVEVLGGLNDFEATCDRYLVDEIFIALPKATPREIRRVVEICEGHNLRFKIVPGVADLIDGSLQVSQLRDVDIEDLLGRDPVDLDMPAIASQLSDKRIVVTGAGGSIGSEMCRQIARFRPNRLVLIEQAENNLFEIDRELKREYPDVRVVPYVADICDAARIRMILETEKPAAIFHAAAHKHVPMMEINPGEAVKNNVLGTKTVADAARECGVRKMVLISTDKAVNPTSVMGCTKRVAELYAQQLSRAGGTQFVTVRFGNVLGSSGSVVPIFRDQIARGGPVTVTHPDMMRYFMTIPEASQLVLQAGAMGAGGEIYVLNMGDPVRIAELARDMITLSGYRPGLDIDIVYTGPRPGEKLIEELAFEGEDISPTRHAKIGIWKNRSEDFDRIRMLIDRLISLADVDNPTAIKSQLRELVAEYHDEVFEESPKTDQPRDDSAATPHIAPQVRPGAT